MIWNDKWGPNKAPLFLYYPFSSFFMKYSYLYSFIYDKLSNADFNIKKIKYSDRISDAIDIFYEKDYSNDAQNIMFTISNLFDEFEKNSIKENYKFVVLGIPEKRGVSEEYQKKFLHLYQDVNSDEYDFRKIDEIFNSELPKKNIDYISLYDLARNNFDKFYFKTDPHWSPKGVELSADYITEELKRRNIL